MKTWVIAATTALLLAGCGGSDSKDEPEATASPTVALLTVEQACRQIEQVNVDLDGPGHWPIPTYGEYGQQIASIAAESVPEIADPLSQVADKGMEISTMSGGDMDSVTDAAAEWADLYRAVADVCARTDAPISRYP